MNKNNKNINKKISIPSMRRPTLKLFSLCLFIMALFSVLFISSPFVYAHPYPPTSSNGAAHWDPVPWPTTWIPYTSQSLPIRDARTADPSNGGTSPQNYANISSSCTDQSQPSVSWTYSPATSFLPETFFFRWKVEQIPNTYATGPSPGTYSNVDPWKSAQWTVLIDINGDGFYDFAVNIDGSSGLPATPIDVIKSIYNTTKSQSIDYVSNPGVHLLFHNPTAFVDPGTNLILNFRNSLSPTPSWPNGSAETVWDYGTTRSTNITYYTPTVCNEYVIDYQIPLAMLDATVYGGPKIDVNTPFCMTFVTANSNVNPLQKDVGFDTAFLGDVDKCVPCGDLITANGGASIPQPTVDWITSEGCGPTTLTAQIRDSINAACQSSVTSVDFYYYDDQNGDGIANDTGSSWILIGAATVDPNNPGKWTRSWNATTLNAGQYLIGVQATDAQSNTTVSYDPAPTAPHYANPSPVPGVVYDIFNNTCGTYAAATKTVNPSVTTVGAPVQFTITVTNNTGSPFNVTQIADVLPSGFSFNAAPAEGGTLAPFIGATRPVNGQTGTLTWTFTAGASIASGATGTLTFWANPSLEGTYTNNAIVTTSGASWTTLKTDPVEISVGAPTLTILKTASSYSVKAGDTITYTITYSNDAPANTTGVTITDTLPVGMNFVAASYGGTYDSATRTITWDIGRLASMEGPYTVSFSVTVDKSAYTKSVNTATIDSNETGPSSASVTVFVLSPVKLEKTADKTMVDPVAAIPGNQVIFTITYTNSGTTGLTNVTITDPILSGFSFVSSAAGTNCPAGTSGGGTVTWSIGAVAAGTTGICNFTLQVSNPYSGGANPAINTATISSTEAASVSATAQIGIIEGDCSGSPTIYYFKNLDASDYPEPVGLPAISPDSRFFANTTVPTSSTAKTISMVAQVGVEDEFLHFYQDPPQSSTTGFSFIGTIDTTLYITKGPQKIIVTLYLYDYNPTTGDVTQIGTLASATGPGNRTNWAMTFNIAPTGVISQGNLILWRFTVTGDGSSNENITGRFDGTSSQSSSSVCFAPISLVFTKQVDKISIQDNPTPPVQTLQYTINFSNTGAGTPLTGAQVIDTLPNGVTYVSATLNGAAATPVGGTCPSNVCTFDVRSSELPAPPMGEITGGQSGTLVINVNVSYPLLPTISTLPNTAELITDDTSPKYATATTSVRSPIPKPDIIILKSTDKTLLYPGDTVTYTLTVLNAGEAASGTINVTDVIPADSYFTYVAGSITGGDSRSDATNPTLTWTINSLAMGASTDLTFQMQVAAAGVPDGFYKKDNFATATEATPTTVPNSNTVSVTYTTNANIQVTKSVSLPVPYVESVGTGDGTTTIFNKTLANTPVHQGILQILVNGTVVGTDSGTGYIIGNNLKNSTIDYTTGAVHLEFITAPAGGYSITASYIKPVSAGDTIEYTMTVTSVGGSTATNVLVNDPVPADMTYNTGTLIYEGSSQTDVNDYPGTDNGHYDALNSRVVFQAGDLAKGLTRTMTFRTTINSSLPYGTTSLTNTASASSDNTSTKQASTTLNITVGPELTLSKSSPTMLPYPLTTVTVGGVGVLTITVANIQYISVGDVISVGGTATTVTAINTGTRVLTLDTAVTAGAGTQVLPTIKFTLYYANTGNADATNVNISDLLQSGLIYISSDNGGVYDSMTTTVSWNIGTLAAGQTGKVSVRVRPPGTGTYLNAGKMRSNELSTVDSNTTTAILGAIELSKTTTTPNIINSAAGTSASYTISLRNEFALGATGVYVTDPLPTGFTYTSTGGITGGVCQYTPRSKVIGTTAGTYYIAKLNHIAAADNRPTTGANWTTYWDPSVIGGALAWISGFQYSTPNQPTWNNCTINATVGATLTIPFTANVAPTVGAGTYQNPVTATSTNMSVLPFDEINTTAEDVTVTVPNDLRVTKAVSSLSSPCNPGACQVVYQVTVTNVGTAIENSISVTDLLPSPALSYFSDTPSQGTYNSGTGAWNVGSLNPTPPGNEATLQITAIVNDFSTYIQNCASLTSSTPADTNSANNTGCADIIPTLVTLSDFRAYENSGKVVVEWSTSSEHDTAGFYLYRLDKTTGDYVRINRKLLPALLTSPQGGTYSLIDKGASPADVSLTYLLVEMEGKGSSISYGPFTVDVGGKSVTGTLNPDTGNLQFPGKCTSGTCADRQKKVSASEITRYFDSNGTLVVTNRKDGLRQQQAQQTDTGTDLFENYGRKAYEMSAEKTARLKTMNEKKATVSARLKRRTGNSAKISVSAKGLYYLSASKMAELLGVTIQDATKIIRKNTLAMSNQGKDVAYLPAQGDTGIFFYGEDIDSKYTKENIYWVWKGSGRRINSVKGQGPSLSGNGTFTEKLHVEQDKFIVPAITQDPNVDYWFWEPVESDDPATCGTYCVKTFTLQANGVADLSTAKATLTVNLYGFSDTPANPDHHVKIYMNDTFIGDDLWDGQQPRTVSLEFDQGLLNDGNNTIKLEGVLDTGAPYSYFYINSFDLTYQRLYKAAGNSLIFKGEGNQIVTIDGFTDPGILVLDVTNPQMPRLNTATTIDGTAGNYRVSFVPASPDTVYLAIMSGAATTIINARTDSFSSLSTPTNRAEYLVIAPELLSDAADSLAAYRQSKGIDTMVVLLEDIMDEFNYGISSPEAIRSFLSYAYKKWSRHPRYVVLLGEGTYDYKDSMGKGDNLMPTLITGTLLGVYPADNLFVDVDGDHVPEMAIGRLPLLTSQEMTPVLDKIKAYEGGTGKRVIMLADNPDSGGEFHIDSDYIAALLPSGYNVVKVYLTDPSQADTVRNTLINELNNGSILMNYTGHAGLDRLAFEGLLRTSDLGSLTNGNAPPVMTAMTCTVGRFAIPGYDSLSEELVLKNGGGAVAVWAPTGLSFNDLAKVLDEGFFASAFGGNAALGDVILDALEHYNSKGGPAFMMDIYNLQGDPALKIR